MKTIILLTLAFIASNLLTVQAQEKGPIDKLSTQMADYFSYCPSGKIFLTTDKFLYKQGETISFNAFAATPIADENLSVGLYDKSGTLVMKSSFPFSKGEAPGTLVVPENLSSGLYFIAGYLPSACSPDQITIEKIRIDHQYGNQWTVKTTARDSISTAGTPNELQIILADLSGNPIKNELLRYNLTNGADILENGKFKTDENGKASVPINIPAKTNGEPFICEIVDIKGEWKHEVFMPTNIDPIVIRFFPEGGTLASGIPGKIGFTACNKWGLPVDVEGSVIGSNGELVAPVKTLAKGLGIFTVASASKQNLKLTGLIGQGQSFALPTPLPNGLSLTVIKTDSAFIYTNLAFADKQKHQVSLVIVHDGKVCWAADMEINQSGRMKLPAAELPQGILQLSAFTQEGNLLAERLIFRDKAETMKIEVKPEKNELRDKEKTTVKVALTDQNGQPIRGSVAVSVAAQPTKQSGDQEIAALAPFEYELETPPSFFPEAFSSKGNNAQIIDILLITNKLKGFDWAKIRQIGSRSQHVNNFSDFNVSGYVSDKNGNKVNKAKVSLADNNTMQVYSATTNPDGMFTFVGPRMANIDNYTVKATTPDGKRELKVEFIKDLPGQISVHVAGIARKNMLTDKGIEIDKKYITDNPTLFPKVSKKIKESTSRIDSQQRQLSSATSILEVIKSIKPYKLSNNQIVFFGSENSLNYQGGALIVIDGQQVGTDISVIQGMSPTEVERINVSTNTMDIQRYTGLNSVGIVEIFLKKGKMTNDKTPKAKDEGNMQTTLQWLPSQKADAKGKFEFVVDAGKIVSDFVIEVKGISEDGRIGFAKQTISVVK